MDKIRERYKNIPNKKLLEQIENDFGTEAKEHLESYGTLTLNEAMAFKQRVFCEVLEIPINFNFYGHLGDIIGFSILEYSCIMKL